MKKEVFVYFGMALMIGALVLVFTETITYNEYLTSGATLVGIVGALYGWFADKQVKKEKALRESAERKIASLKEENSELLFNLKNK